MRGLEAAITGLRRDQGRIRDGILLAGHEAAEILHAAAVQQSPTSKPSVVNNIFTRVGTAEASGSGLAGFFGFHDTSVFRGAGGLFTERPDISAATLTVELGVRGVGVYIQEGTGEFGNAAHGAKVGGYHIHAKHVSRLRFRGLKDGNIVYAKVVFIPGTHPNRFLDRAVEASRREIDELFEAHLSFVSIV